MNNLQTVVTQINSNTSLNLLVVVLNKNDTTDIYPSYEATQKVNNANLVYFEKLLIMTSGAKCLDCFEINFRVLVARYRLINGRR